MATIDGSESRLCPSPEDLSAFASERLDAPEREGIANHLRGCTSCENEVERFKKTIAWLERASERARPRLESSLSATARAALRRSVRAPRVARILASAAAAAVIVVGVGWIALRDRGDGPEGKLVTVESALLRAHAWLVAAQDPDGGWDPSHWEGDPEYRVGLSALAVLALESGGARDEAAKLSIARGVEFLSRKQTESGLFGREFRGAMYNHGLATLALTRVAARGEPVPPDVLERGLARLVALQRGGWWGYAAETSEDPPIPNGPITYWAARAAGEALALLESRSEPGDSTATLVRELRRCATDAGEWLEDSHRHTGDAALRYRGRGGHLCNRELIPAFATSPRGIRRAADAVLRKPLPGAAGGVDFYEVYVDADVLRHATPSDAARSRQSAAATVLLGAQIPNGQLRGSWHPSDRWGPVGGRIYATALATLVLSAGI